jgi:aconitate hydratase
LTGEEVYTLRGIDDNLRPMQDITVVASDPTGKAAAKTFAVTLRIDTPIEIDYYRHGGILPMVLRSLMKR